MAGVRETALRLPSHVLHREVGGETVLLDLSRESYFGLDEIGTRMWDALLREGCPDRALEALRDCWDVEEATLERDLRALARELLQHGLLERA